MRTLFAAIVALILLTPPVSASRQGRLNTTYGLGALTLYELSRGHGTNGLILGAGTYYAYTKTRGRHHRWHRVRIYNRPRGHAYGVYRQVPRGHAFGYIPRSHPVPTPVGPKKERDEDDHR